MIKHKTTYYPDYTTKSFKEYHNGSLSIHEKYNEKGQLIYRERNNPEGPEISKWTYKDGNVKSIKTYQNGELKRGHSFNENQQVTRIYGGNITENLIKYNKDGNITKITLIPPIEANITWMKLYYRKGRTVKKLFYNGNYKLLKYNQWFDFDELGRVIERDIATFALTEDDYRIKWSFKDAMEINILELTESTVELMNMNQKPKKYNL